MRQQVQDLVEFRADTRDALPHGGSASWIGAIRAAPVACHLTRSQRGSSPDPLAVPPEVDRLAHLKVTGPYGYAVQVQACLLPALSKLVFCLHSAAYDAQTGSRDEQTQQTYRDRGVGGHPGTFPSFARKQRHTQKLQVPEKTVYAFSVLHIYIYSIYIFHIYTHCEEKTLPAHQRSLATAVAHA